MIEPSGAVMMKLMPRSATSMPSVAAIVSAPKTTTATALIAPKTRQAASVTGSTAASGQPIAISVAAHRRREPDHRADREIDDAREQRETGEGAATSIGTDDEGADDRDVARRKEARPDPGEADQHDDDEVRSAMLVTEPVKQIAQVLAVEARGAGVCNRSSSLPPLRAPAVDRDRDHQNEALEHGLPVGGEPEEDERGRDRREEPDAEEDHPEVAAPTRQRHAGQDDRGDDRQLEVRCRRSGENGPFDAAKSTPANPTIAPAIVKTANRVFFSEMPRACAAKRLPPTAMVWRP